MILFIHFYTHPLFEYSLTLKSYLVKVLLNPIAEWTGGKIIEVLDCIGEKFEDITRWIEENGEDINNVVEGIGKLFKFVWENVLQPVLENSQKKMQGTIDSIGTILGGLITFLSGVFTGDWEKAWEGIKKIFSGIWNGIVASLESAVNLIIKGINFLVNQLNKVHFETPDWVPIIGGKQFGFNIPNISEIQIPRIALAKGGLAYGATNAIVGDNPNTRNDPEVISPLSTLSGMLSAEVTAALENFAASLISATIMAPIAERGRNQSKVELSSSSLAQIGNMIGEQVAMTLSSLATNNNNQGQETRIVIEMSSREVAEGIFDNFMDVARRRGVNLSFK